MISNSSDKVKILKPLILERTPKTPRVVLDANNLLFEIRGRILPEDSLSFFNPILDWLDTYTQNPAQDTLLLIELEYFDTVGSLMLLSIFKKLELIHNQGNSVHINWLVEHGDTDMIEAGEDFAMQLSLHFEIVEL